MVRIKTLLPDALSEIKTHRTASIKLRWEQIQQCENEQDLMKLQKNYEQRDLVLCQPNGDPVSLDNFDKFFKRILKNTNMRVIRFHDLRHICASLLLGAGVHPKIVQELLGHASIKFTLDTYSHMLPNMQKDALITLDKLLK
ncbi:tyrosine-type recombinase/integrase [Paenibacillus sp. L3-i20]|uniref:tyrosine-type recombinase/integrase n=1 Tax=Paenibacillus sp. L3-i20 TaxID=2905833 RepID=UPI00207EF048|nr:tyrosine-type recombinase/integrase [Paenibacillus sp. L3-i20]GKU79605.1 hypothetical protein L3i20_v240020 [Paenibacillus sp. L3-i20]